VLLHRRDQSRQLGERRTGSAEQAGGVAQWREQLARECQAHLAIGVVRPRAKHDEGCPARLEGAQELLGEPRLADAGVPLEHDDRCATAPRLVPGARQLGERRLPADHVGKVKRGAG
jgi:hypothetical protein